MFIMVVSLGTVNYTLYIIYSINYNNNSNTAVILYSMVSH